MHAGLLSWERSLQVNWKWLFPSTHLPHLGYHVQFWDSPSTREMLANWNEFTWRGVGHTMYVERLNELGEEAQGASRHQYPYLKGAYREDRDGFSQRCTSDGQEAMVTSCSGGNPDQRHGKKTSTLGESVDSPSLEIYKTCWRQLWAIWPDVEVRLPLSRAWDYTASRRPFRPKIWYDAQYLGLYSCTTSFCDGCYRKR